MRFPALGALLLVLAACSTTEDKVPGSTHEEPAPIQLPKPPTASINDGLSELEYVWHLRSALNVAALSCGQNNSSVVTGYNSFLKQHHGFLSEAHSHEQRRANGQDAFDRHMTQIYNHFAWPPYRDHLCRTAPVVLEEALAMSADQLRGWAQTAILRFDQPTSPSRQVLQASVARAVPAALASQTEKTLQLGAFTGRKRAETAWKTISARLHEVRHFKPSYEQVPKSQLVRLRVKGQMPEAETVRLCALAAASGFDCFPVHG